MKKKNQAAQAVRLNDNFHSFPFFPFRSFLLVTLCLSFPLVTSAMTMKDAIQKIPDLKDGDCRKITPRATKNINENKYSKASYSWFSGQLQISLLKSKDAFNNDKPKVLKKLFHPRLKISETSLTRLIAATGDRVGRPYQATISDVWLLMTNGGKPKKHYCESHNISIWSQYGYDIQFGVWLQVLGSKDLAKVFFLLVPFEGTLRIAALHVQQWTHGGKPAGDLLKEVEKFANLGDRYAAFVNLDIVKKLLTKTKHYRLDLYDALEELSDANLSKDRILEEIQKKIPHEKILNISGRLQKKGIGLLLRMLTTKEMSLKQTENACKDIWDTLSSSKILKNIPSIRCSYILPKENINKDGILGSVLFPSN